MQRTKNKYIYYLFGLIVPILFFVFIFLSVINHQLFEVLTEEDNLIEWLTFLFFLIAGILALFKAKKQETKAVNYTPFLLIFGILCILFAFEEISWGQRIFNIDSPTFFLQHSDQQEINVHNFLQYQFNFKTKHVAGIILFIYGGILPLMYKDREIYIFSKKFGLIIPPRILTISFIIAALLMLDFPTGQEEEIGELFFSLCLLLVIVNQYFEIMPSNLEFRGKYMDQVIPIIVAILFFGFVFLYFPFREKLQFDVDEGFNLIRSTLLASGYPLYDQVSSDQPPLFTYLLAGLIRTLGISVTPGRILVLLFSTMMVWSLAQIIQLTWGSVHTILFLPLLLFAPYYKQLSVSIMIGLPALAMASFSLLCLVLWHLHRRDVWLILSGLALGLSVLIKLFTGFLAPIFLIGMTIDQICRHNNRNISTHVIRPGIIWILSFAGLSIALSSILVGPENLVDIIQPHLMAGSVEAFRIVRNTINYHLGGFLPFGILGLFGLLFTILKKRWLTLYLVFWALTAYLLLYAYSPVWYHQQLLVTVPVIMLGAISTGEGVQWLLRLPETKKFQGIYGILSILTLIGFLFLTFNAYPSFTREIYKSPRVSDFKLQAPQHKLNVYLLMREYASQTNWVVTDMPLYAFLIRKPVPPNLATFSEKRLNTGSLTEEEILDTVREYKPEQVLLVFFELKNLEEYLIQNYNLVHDNREYRLYIRKDLE